MEATIATPKELVIAGRTFRPITERTFAQDIYLMTHARAAGLDQVAEVLQPGRTVEDISWTILTRVFESGRTFELLAGYLVEDGVTWTQQSAEETAQFFAQVTDAAAKRGLEQQIVSLVLVFFLSGAASTGISLRSLRPAKETGESAAPSVPGSSAEAATSATGASSSGS